jgi:uncharacterized membrane protein
VNELALPYVREVAGAIDFLGSLILAYGVARALWLAYRRPPSKDRTEASRMAVAESAVHSLGFKAAATLLKAIGLSGWNGILEFATILVLRTLLKREFAWQAERLSEQRRSVSFSGSQAPSS